MSEEKTCETCGATIPADAPGGACPACLLGAGLGGDAAPPEPFDREELAKLLPQFEIEEFVGQGGMGVVYRARQVALDRVVALKILTRDVARDPAFAERFTREARALAALSHPNIVGVFEAGRAGDLWFLTMEYVDGVNLRQAQRAGRLSPAQALAIVPQICDALQYAHDEGVVHRDIKPENILLDRKGHVKIADFGLAKLLRPEPADHTLTGTQQVMGTLHYIAPEQMRTPQEVDHRADIYSLGVVFYEMLTGDLPIGRFPNPSEKVEVDVRLDDVVLRTLERERDRRYQHVSDVKTGIEAIAATPDAAPVKVEAEVRVEPKGSRLSYLAVAGILSWPFGILWALFLMNTGARDEIAIVIPVFGLTGVFCSWLARTHILRDPEGLHGLRLANIGLIIPLVLLLVTVVLGLFSMVLWQDHAEDLREEMGREAENMRREAARDVEEMSFRHRTRWLIERVDAIGKRRIGGDLEVIDPRKKAWLENLNNVELQRLRQEQMLGLALIDKYRLPARLTAFEFHGHIRQGDGARVTLAHGDDRIEFGMVRVGGEWYLEVGPIVTDFPSLSIESPDEVADRIDDVLLALPERSGQGDLDRLEPSIDPLYRNRLRTFDPEVFRRLQESGRLGLAFRPAALLPGLSKSRFTALRPEDFEGGTGRVTVWTRESDHAVRFPVVRVEGEWYLAVGQLEKLSEPTGDLYLVRKQVEDLLDQLPEGSGRDVLSEVEPLIDPRKLEFLHSLRAEQFRALREKDHLGLAFRRDGTLTGISKAYSTEVKPEDFEEARGHVTVWTTDPALRVRFPVVRFLGRWYLDVGPIQVTCTPENK